MRQELTWGTAAAVAIVAAVGISSQSGKAPTGPAAGNPGHGIVRARPSARHPSGKTVQPQCADSLPLLEHFFLHDKINAPKVCYDGDAPPPAPLDDKIQPDFVIATLPDPLHTHFSLLFDRFIEAIQQGAQDEGYEYDSSWMPWETEEPSLALLVDQDEADDRKSKRENQPGILLFRNAKDAPYQKALIVFIVGEESTRGIHRGQFENAIAWIAALQKPGDQRHSVAILGPTFSGSFPSLTDLLAKDKLASVLNAGAGLAVYSGSASSRDDGATFAAFAKTEHVDFRSFVQDDYAELDRFCRFMGRKTRDALNLKNFAILSEDETAYGNIGAVEDGNPSATGSDATHPPDGPCPEATYIYYPRDISTLRAAYQSQSMFSSGSGQQTQDTAPRKSLPTDLADPSGQQHDTVRTYAGNQTSLSQEAQLLGIVDVLRAHRAEYVVLRSSNTLDPLFLANFLRRDYPEARVVVLNSDLLFQRGQDAMALSGVMTLSTYPMFSWAREWTALPLPGGHSHRVFPENSSEGTYVASRLLLQSLARAEGRKPALSCEFGDHEIFLPSLRCQLSQPPAQYAPLPDYAPPFWTEADACGPTSSGTTCKPATWLSVITRHGTWPLAVLNENTVTAGDGEFPPAQDGAEAKLAASSDQPKWPKTPRSTRVLLVSLCCLAVFHALCCHFASLTAKPAFRAHFATATLRHTGLVVIGSYLIALMALLTGWGCGIFHFRSGPLQDWRVWAAVLFVCLVTSSAIIANVVAIRKLKRGEGANPPASSELRMTGLLLVLFCALIGTFFLLWVWPIEAGLHLANRTFAYWRSMNLTSGVSPIVPFLSLIMGLYVWFWYALHGLALFGPDVPRLPMRRNLGVKIQTVGPNNEVQEQELNLSMFSQENVADPAVSCAKPLAKGNVTLILILGVTLGMIVMGLVREVPVRSLGAAHYALIFCLSLDFYFSLILSEAWQIWRTWSSARQLLVFLDRLALRRTLSALHGFSWGSVWKMSGNVLDVRYKLLSRQLECLTHLHRSITLFKEPTDPEEQAAFSGRGSCKTSVEQSRRAGLKFAEWYSENYNRPDAGNLKHFEDFQKQVAETTGVVLTELLVPASRVEKHSLIQVDPDDKCDDDRRLGPSPSKNELLRNAEELVCLTYLGFAQNLLGRIRTIVMGGVCLFVAMTIAVSSYPFDPRPLLSGVLLFLFFAFGGMVTFTYADMHRDATLSHITNTNPGELGSEFWFKVLGYGAAPLLGLITQLFPEWSGFLFSWLQPGLSSLK